MKVGVIAAAGNLGGRIVTECLDRGHTVTAFINKTPCKDTRAQSVQKGLFDLKKEDIADFDVLFSAYGSGFDADPVINRKALNALAALVRGTDVRAISIAGSGCLFADESRTVRVYEQPEHPAFLKGISENTTLGVLDVMAAEDAHYTFVSPGLCFDGDGPRTGDYLTDTSMTVTANDDGASYTAYSDLAAAIVDFAEQGLFDRAFVTVLSRKGTPKW